MDKKTVIAAAVPSIIAIAAAYFAWSATGEAEKMRSEAATTKSQGDRARTELIAARNDLAKVQQELASLKISAEQVRAERDAVRKVLENEQATGVQLRQDIAAAKAQISNLSARLAGRR